MPQSLLKVYVCVNWLKALQAIAQGNALWKWQPRPPARSEGVKAVIAIGASPRKDYAVCQIRMALSYANANRAFSPQNMAESHKSTA